MSTPIKNTTQAGTTSSQGNAPRQAPAPLPRRPDQPSQDRMGLRMHVPPPGYMAKAAADAALRNPVNQK